jgi:uncharacterized membrane protein HdeD (DUF308 family)
MKWFALAMSVLYVVVGCLLLLTTALPAVGTYRSAIGAVLIVYGLLRSVLWYRKNKAEG